VADDPMNGFKIEDGVPLPEARGKNSTFAACVRAMKPGQSVFFAGMTTIQVNAKTAYARQAIEGAKFVMRKVEGGTRMWRIL
jgi:hypothetical protein